MQIAEAFVAVRAQVNPSQFKADVTRGIEQPMTDAAGKAGKKAGDAAGKGLQDGLKKQATGVVATLGSLFAGRAIARGIQGTIDAASALNEQISATGQIFGEAQGQVEDFARGAAEALGQSEVAARQGVNSFGALFSAMGLGADQSAKFGITLTTLASDLASFRDTPIEDAMTALRAGLVGEAEPLRRFGVQLSEVRLQQEALALGLTKSKGPLSAAAKAQAALSLILKDTTLAQGDFNRTRDSAANTERRTQAEIANTSAKIGQNLLPAYQRLQAIVGTLAAAFGSLPGPVQVGTIAIAGIAATLPLVVRVADSVKSLRTSFTESAAGAGRFAGTVKGLGAALGGIGAAAAAAEGISAIFDSLGQEAPNVERLTTATEAFAKSQIFGGALSDAFGDQAANLGKLLDIQNDINNQGIVGKLGAVVADPLGEGATEINRAKNAFESLDQTLAQLVSGGHADQAQQLFEFLRDKVREQGGSVAELNKILPNYKAALDDVELSASAGTDATDVYNVAIGGTGDVAQDTTARLKELADTLFTTSEAQLDAADAGQTFRDAQQELNDLRDEAAGRGPAQAAAQERIAEATRRVTDAVEKQADAVKSLEDARKDLADFESGTTATIRDLERQEIVKRKVTTSDEARQKQLDLLKFDQQASEERQRLQDGVADAEGRVEDAAQDVKDAQDDVRKANKERRDAQLEAAAKITEAEREVQRAALDIATGYVDIVAKQGAASEGAAAYRTELEKVTPVLQGLVDLNALLAGTALPGKPTAQGQAARNIGTAKLNQFQLGGVVPGTGPQLAIVHGGETVTPAGQPVGGVTLTMQNNFHGGDVPTVTQLDAIARKAAIRVRNLGRKP